MNLNTKLHVGRSGFGRSGYALRLSYLIVALFTWGSSGCERGRGEQPAQQAAGRPGDCESLRRRVCAHADEKSSICQAANALVPFMTDASCALNLTDFAAMQQKLTEYRKPCERLVNDVCAAAGEGEVCKAVKEQTVGLSPPDCGKLLGNVKTIVEDLERQERGRHPLDAAMQAELVAGDPPAAGPKDAKVTVVEFSDFQCPFCARAAQTIEQLRKKYDGKVRFVFRQFPLPNHNEAQPAARAALAAHAQGKFWQYHARLFADQRKLDAASLERHAAAEGLDLARFRKDLDSEAISNRVMGDQLLGANISVSGTPTVFVNGKRINDPGDLELMAREIESALGG
jgi:protein-disulfide isomerase